jgi:hypothetical protein
MTLAARFPNPPAFERLIAHDARVGEARGLDARELALGERGGELAVHEREVLADLAEPAREGAHERRLLDLAERAQAPLGGEHVTVHYLSEERVDFRELVPALARRSAPPFASRSDCILRKCLCGCGCRGRCKCGSNAVEPFSTDVMSRLRRTARAQRCKHATRRRQTRGAGRRTVQRGIAGATPSS